jgi:hypothetical protein
MRLTVGPLPSAVYWRRRAIVLGVVLVALFLVAQACMSASASPEGGSRGGPPPTGSPSPGVESPVASGPASPATGQPVAPAGGDDPATVDPAEAPDPDDEDACADTDLLIVAEAEPDSFPRGTEARFTIRIRNDSSESCRRDVGGDRRELYLRTGATKVWSSRECGAPTGSEVAELAPADEKEHYLVWNGRASDSCDGGEPAGQELAAGEYELVARLGTAYSDPLPVTIR